MNRFTWLSYDGTPLPPDAAFKDVGAIRLNATGLLIAPKVGKPKPWEEANGRAAELKHGDWTWRAASIDDIVLVPDRTLIAPAFDQKALPFLAAAYAEGAWLLWSNTASAAHPESYAWGVHLYNGYANLWPQANYGLALSVCGPFPSPGQ